MKIEEKRRSKYTKKKKTKQKKGWKVPWLVSLAYLHGWYYGYRFIIQKAVPDIRYIQYLHTYNTQLHRNFDIEHRLV